MNRPALLAATALLTMTGCVTIPDSHPLSGTEWQLAAIDTSGSTTTLTPALQQRHTIRFMNGGELAVQLDCNRGRSTWIADQTTTGAGAMTIGPVASTKMLCPQPSFGDQLAGGLTATERYLTTLDGRQLVLETPELRFTFTAIE